MNEKTSQTSLTSPPSEELLDIKQLLLFLWRKKFIIVIIMIISGLLGIVLKPRIFPRTYITSCDISLKFRGVETHHNPDGSIFSPQQIISPSIIENAISSHGLDASKYSGVEKHLSITPIIPEGVTRTPDNPFFPTQYSINFTTKSDKPFSANEKSKFLNYVVDSFRKNYRHQHGGRLISQLDINKDIIQSGDYVDVISTYETIIDNLILTIDDRIKESNNFISPNSGLSFEQIKNNLKLLRNVTISKPKSLVQNLKITKDKDSLLNLYQFQIMEKQAECDKKLSEAEVANNLLEKLTKPDHPGMPAENEKKNDDLDGEKISLTVGKSLIDDIRKNDYYQTLVNTALSAETTAGNLKIDIAQLKRNLDELKKNENNQQNESATINKIESLLKTLEGTLKVWFQESSKLNQEFVAINLGDVIQIASGPSSVILQSRYVKLFLAFMVLLPVGCFTIWAAFSQIFCRNQ